MSVIRFIYVYRERSTGRAVYVGSAFDVARRDIQHCKRKMIPFEREIARRGRDAFTLEIVEALKAETVVEAMRVGVARENQWMDVLDTFRAEGCFNFLRNGVMFDTEEQWAARNAAMGARQKIVQGTPEKRARASAVTRAAITLWWKRSDVRQKMKDAWTPEKRSRRIASLKRTWSTPTAQARKSAASKAARCTPEARASQSEISSVFHAKRRRARSLAMLPFPLKFQTHYAALRGVTL